MFLLLGCVLMPHGFHIVEAAVESNVGADGAGAHFVADVRLVTFYVAGCCPGVQAHGHWLTIRHDNSTVPREPRR